MDLQELKATAELANLELSDEELSSLSSELKLMLNMMSRMQEVDIKALPVRKEAVQKPARLRPDVQKQDIHPDTLLEGAPELEGRYIVIPNVL